MVLEKGFTQAERVPRVAIARLAALKACMYVKSPNRKNSAGKAPLSGTGFIY